jgi:formamidopyrimidine-DNA glycosylase
MPELPEVETVVRGIRPHLVGRTILHARFAVPRQLLPQTPRSLARVLKGQRIESVRRRGKFILIETGRGTFLVHLRMTGRLYLRAANAPMLTHERAWLELDDGRLLVFHDPRTLGTLRYFPAGATITPLANMGTEPLDDEMDLDALHAKLRRRQIAIKPLLLNQSLWAGIGNIYASEALWEAGIDPRKLSARLTRKDLERLHQAVVDVLTRAVTFGGTTISDFAAPDGTSGRYYSELNVYDREAQPCPRCGRTVQRIVQAQRSTYFCASCQKRR